VGHAEFLVILFAASSGQGRELHIASLAYECLFGGIVRSWKTHLAVCILAGSALGGSAALPVSGQALAASPVTTCTNLGNSPPYSGASLASTTLDPQNQRTNTPAPITFTGSNGDHPIAPYTYTVNGKFPNLSKLAWGLSLINGNDIYPQNDVAVHFYNSLGSLQVVVCIRTTDVSAGSYSGSLGLAGGGIKPVQLPLTINIKYAGWPLIFLGMLVAAIVGVFVKWWMTKIGGSDPDNSPKLSQFAVWLWRQKITVLIAVLGAAYVVFQSKYVASSGFTIDDCWSLWVATGVAVSAASLLTTTFGAAVQPSTSNNLSKAPTAPSKAVE
jgi:hypothetical protein